MIDDRFWQKKEMWAGLRLGTRVGSTIGGEGCLVCSEARALTRRTGVYIAPWELNKALVEIGGYVNGNDLRFAAITQLEPQLRFVDVLDFSGGPFSLADEAKLQQLWETGNYEFLVQVDFRLTIAGLQQHWVHVDRISDGPRRRSPYLEWYAYDPRWGEIVELERYTKPNRHLDYSIWRVVIYVWVPGATAAPTARELEVSSRMPLLRRGILIPALTGGRRGRR
jgi:hypothetical protein